MGVATSMVTVLISAAILMPPPSGTATAQASFMPNAVTNLMRPLVEQAKRVGKMASAVGSPERSESVQVEALSYDLNAVIKGEREVPRITLASVPVDLEQVRETNERKALFFKTVLPLVLQVNEQIALDRERLWELNAKKKVGAPIEAVDRLWLAVMAERYQTARGDVPALLRLHDVVPPSLALAQAATESAWGTSRFVKEGNAIFGQWTFVDEHDGIVPNNRADGKTHRIRAFNTLYDSVFSYVTNLNRHRAYQEFRAARAEMRANGQPLDGLQLASTLHRYSERGTAYVDELRTLISTNDLTDLDGARLSRTGTFKPLI